ncbi:MAG: polysulfide reductase NrfD [Chloroflexi bacterium]|nr:polysulfide reductase NrfD [Chloroflexota bacterium]
MENIEWGILVVNYLFLAGLSAGAFAVSSFATYIGGPHFRRVARIGALVAPFPVAIGVGLLVLDLGRPLAFYNLFLIVQFTSPMSIGSWLLTGFIFLSLAYAALWLPAPFDNLLRLPSRLSDVLHFTRWHLLSINTIRRWHAILAAVGFPIALGVGIYTGILLGAIPSRPFWNTPMVAQLFLFSAMSSGTAIVLLITALLGTRHESGYEEERRLLVSTDMVLIVLEIFMIVPFLLHHALSTQSSASSIELILGGEYTAWFWIGVILLGILLPLFIEAYDLFPVILKEGATRYSLVLSGLSAILVLVGGFVLRFVFVYAGQASHFMPVVTR